MAMMRVMDEQVGHAGERISRCAAGRQEPLAAQAHIGFQRKPGIRSPKPAACSRNEHDLIVKTNEGHYPF